MKSLLRLSKILGRNWKGFMEKGKMFVKKHPIWTLIITTVLLGIVLSISVNLSILSSDISDAISVLLSFIMLGPVIGAMFIMPVLILIAEFIGLVCEGRNNQMTGIRIFDIIAITIGSLYEFLYISFMKNVEWSADWGKQLSNASTHTPIYSKAAVTISIIFILAIVGYFILQYVHMENMAPLVVVFAISAMYLGIIQLIILTVQVIELDFTKADLMDLYLLILPACSVIIAARTILKKIHEWNEMNKEMGKIEEEPILTFSERIIENAKLWPSIAVLLMLPLLGILIMILVLFGQAPDSVIKAWTETSDWALSQKQSPPNIYYDEHYLCTVAAGGHRKIVKPLRKGVRHGHEVIVNRQLCIANAFEEIIQEKTPRFHRAVRSFYDRYGFPLAKMIRNKWQADVVYVIMKPLEWIFLLVLYSVDVHPENRIAVQYMGKVPDYRR